MLHRSHNQKDFYGTVTIGEKGQIVIPVDARENMKLKKGDRLLVFGMHENMLAIVKLSQIEHITARLSETAKALTDIHKKGKK